MVELNILIVKANSQLKLQPYRNGVLKNLGNRIETTEYLDNDAFESKQLQLLYIDEAIDDFFINDYAGAVEFISPGVKEVFSTMIAGKYLYYFKKKYRPTLKGGLERT